VPVRRRRPGVIEGRTVINHFVHRISTTARADEGQALVEYALIILLVALVTISGLQAIGTNVNNILNAVAGAL
jgi:Flp pilus assembly pilin Flp